MGDDGEMFSSSEFNQPSPDGAGELKDAAQIPESGEKLETSDMLAVSEEKAGADETWDMRAAAEVEVGGGGGLEGSVMEENAGGELEEEDAVTNEEGSTEVPAVVEVEPREGATSAGGIENRDSTVGAGEEETIFTEYVNSPADELGVAEGEAKTVDLQVESSIEMTVTETELEKAEEVREAAVEESYMETPVAENEMEKSEEILKADVEEASSVAVAENEIEMVEEMLKADAEESPAVAKNEFEMIEEKLKVDVEEPSRVAVAENEIEMVEEKLKADTEESSAAAENEFEMVEEMLKVDVEEPSAAAESEIERVEEMLNADVGHSSIVMTVVEKVVEEVENEAEKVEEVPKTEVEVADEVMDLMDVKEDVVVADTELGDIDSAQELENVDGHETAPVVDDADTKQLPFTAAAAGKEAVVEDSKDGEDGTIAANLECVSKDDMETETELVEEMSIGKAEPEAEIGEGAYAECSPNSDEVEKTVAADEEPDLIGSEMDYKTVAGEETSNDDKLASSQEEAAEDMVAEEGSPLDEQELVVEQEEEAMEMENHSSSGEEQELVVEQEEGKTETTEGDNDNAESTPEMDDADQVPQDEGDEDMAAREETETDVGESSRSVGEKHKKRRNSKVVTNSRLKSHKIMEDNVCFICFDGGDLVLCDRRGCPKAYHPSCVDRDEAFFRSKGRWTCGWHLCHVCKKAAHYLCYTCPHSSVCKGCAKDAAILCVRGNKGFCETCKRTIMLIENGWEGIHDGKKIDFDDKSSWEFLYKDYYTELKSKLSLTSAEIDKAKNPVSTRKEEAHGTLVKNKDGGTSSNGAKDSGGARPKRKRVKKKQSRSLPEEEDSADAGVSVPTNEEWASKELLEFVMHMKNGDRSVVSQFDVQALLLEYITRKNLRDPNKMSQIKCDARLANLFGKRRVGHFEMLKLLESHFLLKEDSHTDDVEDSIVDYDAQVGQLEADENDDTETTGVKEKKRKVRRKSDKGPLSNRLDYAAIDTHNINLIYLRRKLMEDILEEGDDFQNKVVGTFVRIRISGNNQKQDLYRLVQVVGTSKADEPYKFGKRTTDLMLEILNLNKTEIVSIDTISNQDFTEDECKRLRQSIKCGLLNRMTVGDILDKAMELQTARVDDWLESETLRLSHLRDRASDMGHRKELRECVEKLQVLKTPEERLRRLEEIPKIHVDPKMDPNNESEEDESESDDNRQEGLLKTTGSVFGTRRGRAPISPGSDVTHKESWNGGNGKSWESNRNFFSKTSPTSGEYASGESSDMVNNNTSWNQGRERAENRANLISSSMSENTGLISNARSRSDSFSGGTTNSLVAFPTKEEENFIKINEAQKMWHYKDPAGKVQGPFSMTQLRKWNNTGYFPNGLKIWRAGENQDVDSIILTDALAGRFQKKSSVDSQLSMAAATRGLSSHYMKTSEPPSHRSVAPSVEVLKPSPEKWSRSDLQNLPSPTPGRSIAGNLLSRTSGNASAPISRDQPMNGQENSAHALQATLLAQLGEVLPVEDRGQNTWGGAPPPNVDSNTLTPVVGQQQAYNQWGAQNPTALPQPEYWGSNNQQNMQTPAMPNMGWVAPAQGPLPTNMNWTPPTVNPNTGWAMGLTGDAANVNGGWGTQPSPMGGANAGWVAQPPVANVGPAVQVPVVPGPGWTMPNGNQGPPGQGWNQGWAPDKYGSGGSQGGDSGYGPRPWNNRQSSFGRRPDLRNTRRDMLCPYNANGRCRKGDRCNYIHS